MSPLLRFAIRICPWPWLEWFCRRYTLCWASLVMVKMGYDWEQIGPVRGCFDGRPGEEYDYCGWFQTREAFDKAVAREHPILARFFE